MDTTYNFIFSVKQKQWKHLFFGSQHVHSEKKTISCKMIIFMFIDVLSKNKQHTSHH